MADSFSRYNRRMKLLFDLFPVIFFFAAFKVAEHRPQAAADLISPLLDGAGLGAAVALDQAPILIATIVVMVATAVQIAWVKFRHGSVDKILWVSLALVVFFGGLTLILRDATFIKWKPTVLYWIFSLVLLVSATFLKKNLIRDMLDKELSLPEPLWARLNLAWSGFFALMGFANLYVAFNFSTSTWADFKMFGASGLMFAFIVAQGLFLAKYMEEKK
jgi:intracellular septation protein